MTVKEMIEKSEFPERDRIVYALLNHGGMISEASKDLDMGIKTLLTKIGFYKQNGMLDELKGQRIGGSLFK